MSRKKDKNKAIILRLKGYSYSQIKEDLGISKSTLSGWLAPYPLSADRIKELRDWNPRRIENFRNTMAKKRLDRLNVARRQAKKDLIKLSDRDIFIGGLFLYWGEGLKSETSTTCVSNTDPAMIRFFIKWLKVMNIEKSKIKIRLQLYSDMDISKEKEFWRNKLRLPKSSIFRVSIKKSKLAEITYRNGFGHGTCELYVYSTTLKEYILMSLEYIKDLMLLENNDKMRA